MSVIKIADRMIGDGYPTFIIAEAGANWRYCDDMDKNYEHALELVNVAKESGADAVKFQIYRADRLYVPEAGKAEYIEKDESIYDIIKNMEFPYEWLDPLKEYCDKKDILFLATPFDEESADRLEEVGIPAWKIASYTISHFPLIKHIAAFNKPVIFSTGASDMKDIKKAVDIIRCQKDPSVALMQCTAKYPAPLGLINVKVIRALKERFNMPVGLSDHSREPYIASLAAVWVGANIIEKHFTTSNDLEGPDHGFAVIPDEFKELVKYVRELKEGFAEERSENEDDMKELYEFCLKRDIVRDIKELEEVFGTGNKKVCDGEEELYAFCRRTMYAARDIDPFKIVSSEDIAVLRSGHAEKGLDPSHYEDLIGKKAKAGIKKNMPLKEDMFE